MLYSFLINFSTFSDVKFVRERTTHLTLIKIWIFFYFKFEHCVTIWNTTQVLDRNREPWAWIIICIMYILCLIYYAYNNIFPNLVESKFYQIKPKSDCICQFPIDLEPNDWFVRLVSNQSVHGKNNLISVSFNKISLCVCTLSNASGDTSHAYWSTESVNQ